MTNSERVTFLFELFADGSINREEYTELTAILKLTGNDDEIFAAMDEIWKSSVVIEYHTGPEIENIYTNLVNSPKFKNKAAKMRSFKNW